VTSPELTSLVSIELTLAGPSPGSVGHLAGRRRVVGDTDAGTRATGAHEQRFTIVLVDCRQAYWRPLSPPATACAARAAPWRS
jgi:hypothetical protein